MPTDIGPVQLFVMNFEHPEFKGRIAEELDALRSRGDVRIVDSIVVLKDEAGEMMTERWSDLEETDGIRAGTVLAGLIGLELSDEGPADAGQVARAIADEGPDAAGSETLQAIFADVAPGGAVVLLLVEHLWALPLTVAVRDAGGVLSGQQMITEATLRRIPGVLAAAAQDGRS